MAISKGKKSTSYVKGILPTGSSVTGTIPTKGQKYSGGQTSSTGGRGNATRGMTMGKGSLGKNGKAC